MKKWIAVMIWILFFVALVLWFRLPPGTMGNLGTLKVLPGTIQTNVSGGIELVSSVSNAGPNKLRVWVGIQSKQGAGWVAVASNNRHLPILSPGTEAVITNLFPNPAKPWRVFAAGQRVYPYTRLGTARVLFDRHVLKREIHRYYYSAEMK